VPQANGQATDAMKRDIASAQEYLVEHEHICSLDNPPVIREYLMASEEDRGIFEVLLKTYKTNTVLKAKQAWYEWKREFLEMVRPDVEAILGDMQEVSFTHPTAHGAKCAGRACECEMEV
jgi:kinetochore protein Spc7/SPC105